MTSEALLREAFVSLEVNATFSEAALVMRDASRLCFCHRVGQRWARAEGGRETSTPESLAHQVLSQIAKFRLNAKHLEVEFQDSSRWEARF